MVKQIGLISLLALVPCFWQPRIVAGDLGAHVYAAWLTQLIEQGQAPGLTVVPQFTNVLFDILLAAAAKLTGLEWATRLVVALSVLILVWGSFRFVEQVSGVRAWFLAPSLLILAYGWAFHYGFLNFHLGLGLVLWGLAAAWNGNRWTLAGGLVLMAAAVTAHPLPVAWGAGMLAYHRTARFVPEGRRWWVAAAAIGAIALLRVFLMTRYETVWAFPLVPLVPADQAWVFGLKYYALVVLLEMLWGFLFLRLVSLEGFRATLQSVPFQLFAVTLAFVFLIPMSVKLPWYKVSLTYIPERMTLPLGILLCAVLARARPVAWQKVGLSAIAALFFVSLFADLRALNRVEARMEQLFAALPEKARVVAAIDDPGMRVGVLAQMADRACVGHCYSYAHYETASGAFRVRAAGPTPIVETDPKKRDLLQDGGYQVTEADLPLYQLTLCGTGIESLCVKPLQAGDVIEKAQVTGVTPLVWW